MSMPPSCARLRCAVQIAETIIYNSTFEITYSVIFDNFRVFFTDFGLACCSSYGLQLQVALEHPAFLIR